MGPISGISSPEALRRAVADGSIDTVIVAFTDHFGRLMGKRFDAEFFCDDALGHGTHGCNYLLTVDMDMEPVEGYAYANWSKGYGDFHLVPDLSTLRLAGWTQRTALVLCDVVEGHPEAPVPVAPRSILSKQIDRLNAAGHVAKAASELECFVFDESYRDAHDVGYRGLTTSGWYNEDYHLLQGARVEPFIGAARRALKASGIPVENSKGEAAPGQHELNIRYAEVMDMADRHTIMKHAMKELADAQGISCTFMAKPVEGQSGSSCHIHLSLWDQSGSPRFADSDGPTDAFRWFLGGWMAHIEELMVMYAPTVNSYKRYQPASWAPTKIAWSTDNRTAGFRVVGSGPSLRIECRVPGADVNPYLAYAAALASGLDGIENRIEPPAELRGDGYSTAGVQALPTRLSDAVDAFEGSQFARDAFGSDVVDHYVHFARQEDAAWRTAVTDWERQRYFERI
ncbi:MAG: glutamine synthetase family protein [Acidimicrobiales bacterium]